MPADSGPPVPSSPAGEAPPPSPAPARPPHRASAVVVLVRGEGVALQVFWALRSDAVSYMPGFRSFVGGTADPQDAELPIDGTPAGAERAVVACALREAFEEAGVLVGVPEPGPAARVAEARRRLLAGEATFPALAHEHGWSFRGDALAFAGRWVSPPFVAHRFETDYFLARVPDGQEATIHPGELAEGGWVHPRLALERWRAGHETFAAPILWTLIALAEGGDDLAARLAEAPRRAVSPVRRIELKWGIVLHPMKTRPLPPATHTNAYLVGESEMALVDPGSGEPAELDALFALIDALRGDGRELKLVLLTHHHADHSGGVEAASARYHVPVAAHAENARLIRLDR